jgi:hypothetical protein
MNRYPEAQQWWHRLCGHSIVTRPAEARDDCLTHTVGRFGAIIPIYLDVCSCGVVW